MQTRAFQLYTLKRPSTSRTVFNSYKEDSEKLLNSGIENIDGKRIPLLMQRMSRHKEFSSLTLGVAYLSQESSDRA